MFYQHNITFVIVYNSKDVRTTDNTFKQLGVNLRNFFCNKVLLNLHV